MKLILLSLVLLNLAIPSRTWASEDEEALPGSWYTLPEDEDALATTYDSNASGELSPKAQASIDRVLDINAEAFDRMEARWEKLGHTNEKKKWYLAACILDVSISASGVVGMLVVKGEASAALYWRKKQAEHAIGETELSNADASFTGEETPDEVQEKLEPLVQAVMATGDVRNEEALRKNLQKGVLDYHLIVQHLTQDIGTKWEVSKLRLDFQIDISGKVNPATTVGGGVRVRFEWEPKKILARVNYSSENKVGENVRKLIEDLAKTLETVSYDGLATTGFDLKTLKFALGLFAEGKAGVVKVGGSIFGHVYFKRKAGYVPPSNLVVAVDPITVIDYTGKKKWENWADDHSIPFRRHEDLENRGRHTTAYSVSVESFRKGLERSVQIGTKLAERAGKHVKKWEVYQIKAEFALSLSGGTSLFKLGGTGSLELAFQKAAKMGGTL